MSLYLVLTDKNAAPITNYYKLIIGINDVLQIIIYTTLDITPVNSIGRRKNYAAGTDSNIEAISISNSQ